MIFLDDYSGYNLLLFYVVFGMVFLYLIKVINFFFVDKKLLEKKKKVYCVVEVDFECKVFMSFKRVLKSIIWDEVFDVEVQYGCEICLFCFILGYEFDKLVVKVFFNLLFFV